MGPIYVWSHVNSSSWVRQDRWRRFALLLHPQSDIWGWRIQMKVVGQLWNLFHSAALILPFCLKHHVASQTMIYGKFDAVCDHHSSDTSVLRFSIIKDRVGGRVGFHVDEVNNQGIFKNLIRSQGYQFFVYLCGIFFKPLILYNLACPGRLPYWRRICGSCILIGHP